MTKSFSTLLIFIIVIFSCGSKGNIPENVISQKKIVSVIWDMKKADEYVQSFIMKDSTCDKKKESAKLYADIFAIHKISQQQFEESLAFYKSRPDFLKPVMDSLNTYEKKVNEERYLPKPIPSPDTSGIKDTAYIKKQFSPALPDNDTLKRKEKIKKLIKLPFTADSIRRQ